MDAPRDDDVLGWERRLAAAEAFNTAEQRSLVPYLNYRVGHALRLVGQAGAALARFARAVTISKGLPQTPNAAEDLAFLTYETAMLAYELGTVDASTWLDEGVRAHQALRPTAETLDVLAMLQGKLGDWNRSQGDRAWAIEFYQQAIVSNERACEAAPASPSSRHNLAVSCSKLAAAQEETGALAAAFDTHVRALEVRQVSARAAPGDEVARAGPLMSLEALVEVAERMQRPDRHEWASRLQRERESYRRSFPGREPD